MDMEEEWAVVDDSCRCRVTLRSLGAAKELLKTNRLPNRDISPVPLRLEKRYVTEWEKIWPPQPS